MFEGVLILSALAAVGVSVSVDPETSRVLNQLENIVQLILVIYIQRTFRKSVKPKIQKIEENTNHLSDWDGKDRREE